MHLEKKKNDKFTLMTEEGAGILLGNSIDYHYVLVSLHGYEQRNVMYDRVRISIEKLKSDFQIVENFQSLDYKKKSGILEPYYFVYKHKKLDFFITTVRDGFIESEEEEDWFDGTLLVGEDFKKVGNIYYKSGDGSLEEISTTLNGMLDCNYDSHSKVSIVLKTNQGFVFKEVPIKPMVLNIDTMYNDDLKPIYEHLVEHLKTGNKGIALLHGEAGTGKSNLIRHLTTVIPAKRFVFLPVSMISSLTDPMFLSTLIDNKGSILILEDCENYIKDRKSDSVSNVVSSILNITDGILSDVLGLQLICTFNSSIKDVDSALLRRGRLIVDYEFKSLDEAKAQKLVESLGSKLDMTKDKPTLANIFNCSPPASEVKTNKIGF